MSSPELDELTPNVHKVDTLDNYFYTGDVSEVGDWVKAQVFDDMGIVLGCTSYGRFLAANELGWVGDQLEGGKGLILGIDPGVSTAVQQLDKDIFGAFEDWGDPRSVTTNNDNTVLLVNGLSGDFDLLEPLKGKASRSLIVAAEPSLTTTMLNDSLIYLKEGGISTVVMRVGDFFTVNSMRDMNVTDLVSTLVRRFPVSSGSNRVLTHSFMKSEFSKQLLTKAEYIERGFPRSNGVTADFIRDDEELIILNAMKHE